MRVRVATLVLTLAFTQLVCSFDSRNIVFIIVSQREPYHASVAARLKQSIEDQIMQSEQRRPHVLVTHVDLNVAGAWTIVPLLGPLLGRYRGGDVRWALFVEPHTAVRARNAIDALARADTQHDVKWIGYPLSDDEPTIIHHFAIFEDLEDEGGFVYPNFASGFAMRLDLMETLLNQIDRGERHLKEEFSIDPSFELTKLIYGDANTQGPLLASDHSFCIVAADNCATYPRQFDICGSAIPERSIFFAVKTWSGFHGTRAKVVKKTWGRYVSNLAFYSDTTDLSLPALDTGVPNTKTGHCLKTMTILKMAVQAVKNRPYIKWIFLADDDTILGVQRLCEVLSCYRGGDDVTVVGERYGYGYGKKETAAKGFDYITLGGGAALSVGAARALSTCVCAAPAAPDDMALGVCARTANVTLTHSPLFHQGRPQDYPREVLARDRPATFHRHSAPDPHRVYSTWFHHDDLALRPPHRDEL